MMFLACFAKRPPIKNGFVLEWVLEDSQLARHEYDEYFYDASSQITLRGNG